MRMVDDDAPEAGKTNRPPPLPFAEFPEMVLFRIVRAEVPLVGEK